MEAGKRGKGVRYWQGLVVGIVLMFSALFFTQQASAAEIENKLSFGIGDIIITEIRDGPNGQEQVELFNQATMSINMNGWILEIDGVNVDLSPLGIFSSRYYRTVGDPMGSHLRTEITLDDEGGNLRILDPTKFVIDSVSYGQLGPVPDPLNSESVARVTSGYFTYSNNWSRSQYPNFGYANTVKDPVMNPALVFNEVMFNAANPNDRFIEVYYRGHGSYDLNGHKIVGDTVYIFPSVLLNSTDRFHAIRPYQAPLLFDLMSLTSTSGDNLYLYNFEGNLLDMVGWSSPHWVDMSMARVPDGNGSSNGYNDPSSIVAGWQFDQIPTLPYVLIGPHQFKYAELGDTLYYALNVKNKDLVPGIMNIETELGPQSWPMVLYTSDGVTPLLDSPGDADNIPDTGLLQPGGETTIQVSVEVPSTVPTYDWEVGKVTATIAENPLAKSYAKLTSNIYPYVILSSSVNPSTIWVEGSPPQFQPQETEVSIRIDGRGSQIFRHRPQDVVFLIDSSGSMGGNDPQDLRIAAAKHYVDMLMLPDMAAVVDFDSNAILVNNDHLSSDYELIKKNIDKIDSSGSTNLFDPIRIATDELIQYGDNSHVWVEILLTDGEDTTGHSHSQILGEAQRAANNGIVIYTIGLGRPTSIDEPLLIDIATITGGKYLRAQSANDLDAIYMEISKMVKKGDVAAYDDNIYDNIPLVNVLIPNYIHYVPGTAAPLPSYIGQYDGKMNLQWNVSEIKINQTWFGKFKVTSSLDGLDLQSMLYPDTIASYIRHDGQRYIDPFPEVLIDVLAVKGGKICGCKWYDRDKDGFIDSDEPIIEGFKIELFLDNTLEQSAYTDANGTYCFDDLDEGNYTVKEVMPDDPGNYFTWLQTYPGGNGTWEISVIGIFEKLNADFGNVVEFTGGRSWGYWKTHTGLDSPPRDETYNNLIHYPFEIDVTTPDGDGLVESDVEAKWVFEGTGSGEPPNCSGTCRSLFRVQLLALHLNVLKFGGMEFLTYIYLNDQYSGWTIREIIDEGIDRLLTGGLSYSFTNFQETLDKINNNHHRSNGSYVLVMSDPPVVCYTLCKHQINSYTGPPKITEKSHYCTILDNVELSEVSIEDQISMRKIKQKHQRLSTFSTEHFLTIVKRPPVILLP